MAIWLPPHIEYIRLGKPIRIPVRSTNAQRHARTRRHLATTDLSRNGRRPIAKLIGTLKSQKLFNRRSDQPWIIKEEDL